MSVCGLCGNIYQQHTLHLCQHYIQQGLGGHVNHGGLYEFIPKQQQTLPRVIESDRIVFMDCDSTLILWDKVDLDLPTVTINGREFQVHTKHLQKIKDYATMGFVVFIWSNSGYKWAVEVAQALGVSDKVTCMSKPHRVFDDAVNLGDTIKHGYIKL